MLLKQTAINEEIRRISLYGRRDKGTGILTNMTDGGDGGNTRSGKRAYNNGKEFKWFYENEQSDGWILGNLLDGQNNPMFGKHNGTLGRTGEKCPLYDKRAYNNGKIYRMFYEGEQPDNWTLGSLKDHNGSNNPMYGVDRTGEKNTNYGKRKYINIKTLETKMIKLNEAEEDWVLITEWRTTSGAPDGEHTGNVSG